jgi:ketosteroid isomerase-like protein
MQRLIAISLFVLGAAGCGTHQQIDSQTEAQKLMQASRDWAAAVARGDMTTAISYWTDDAVMLPPDQAALIGKPAIIAYVTASASVPGFSITWEPERAVVSASGDLGYIIENNTVTFTDSSGVKRTQHGKVVTVWRRLADGSWKNVVDSWSNSPSPRVFPR